LRSVYILWCLTWRKTKNINKLSRVRSTDWKSALILTKWNIEKTKLVYTCEQLESFVFNLIPKDTFSQLHFCMESPPAGRVWVISQNTSISKITLAQDMIWLTNQLNIIYTKIHQYPTCTKARRGFMRLSFKQQLEIIYNL